MSEASPLVLRHLESLHAAAQRGPVVDLACGRGRNALALARAGCPVLGLDRNDEPLRALQRAARSESLPIELLRVDLEAAIPPPLIAGSCAALIVCRYLHRPLAPWLEAALQPGGWLLYETFTLDQRELGYGPRNEAFLLKPGELPGLFPNLECVARWEGRSEATGRPEAVAQLAARKPPPAYCLTPTTLSRTL